MGVIKQGILGGFSGKVANVVGTSWKGIAVMKALPLSVANPRTAAQVAQRTKMSACVAMLQPILSQVIKPLNDRFAGKMSGFNYALQASISAFSNDGDLNDPEKFKISRAANKAQLIDAIAAEAKITKLKATWTSDAGKGYALATDKCYLVGYCVDNGTFAVSTSAIRSAGQAYLEFPDGAFEAGAMIEVYMAFLRADGTVGFAQDYKRYVAVAP
ncbi:MAG: hypothetical protein GX465_15505 [Acidobacteria bacterium]|nr:hypothetical protein [Acidobacteriota bacterium]